MKIAPNGGIIVAQPPDTAEVQPRGTSTAGTSAVPAPSNTRVWGMLQSRSALPSGMTPETSEGTAPFFVWYEPNGTHYTTSHAVLVEGKALGKNGPVYNAGEPNA